MVTKHDLLGGPGISYITVGISPTARPARLLIARLAGTTLPTGVHKNAHAHTVASIFKLRGGWEVSFLVLLLFFFMVFSSVFNVFMVLTSVFDRF